MTIIFQLFCAKDLQRLEKKDLDDLKVIVLEALKPESDAIDSDKFMASVNTTKNAIGPKGRNSLNDLLKKASEYLTLKLDRASNKTLSDAPKQIKALAHEMLNIRQNDVYQQLRSSRKLSPFSFENPEHRYNRLNSKPNEVEIGPEQTEKESMILDWAISCEANNLRFYANLLRARNKAYKFFEEKTGQRPEGPDSLYSPFNPSHPLYKYYAGFYDASSQ